MKNHNRELLHADLDPEDAFYAVAIALESFADCPVFWQAFIGRHFDHQMKGQLCQMHSTTYMKLQLEMVVNYWTFMLYMVLSCTLVICTVNRTVLLIIVLF